jgi:transposase
LWGRSSSVDKTWLKAQPDGFVDGVEQAALDPFRGYANAIHDGLPDAVAVLDAFHVVRLGTQVVDEVRRRVQQDTWQCYQQLRSIYHVGPTKERAIAQKVLDSFHTCPIPEVARLGRTLRAWRTQILAYFDTSGVSNGGTEPINLIIEKCLG